VIEAALPIIFSLFLGSWSDKHGSKIPMVLSLFGYTISTIMYTTFSYIPNVDPGILLLASIPVSLTGGLIALIMSAFRYVADITSVENRSFRIAMAEGCWFLGSPFGLLGSAQVLKHGGYPAVFLISTILYVVALLYAVLFVKNDKPVNELESDSNMFQDMFNISAVKDTVHTCFRRRPGYGRFWIVILLTTICFRILTLYGGFSTTFLYTRAKFQWTAATYSTYSTVEGMIGIAGSGTAVVVLMKILKIRDATIGLISSISYMGGTIIFMIASAGWMMYLAGTVQMFCGLISIMIRSMLSKIVAKDEIGKVFSFMASGEATMPLIAAPLYNFVYHEYVATFPGAIYLLSAFFNVCILISFIYFFFVLKDEAPHSELEEEDNRESLA
jgi:PCFT/HCP family folate transporter-like MFS transporter 1/3